MSFFETTVRPFVSKPIPVRPDIFSSRWGVSCIVSPKVGPSIPQSFKWLMCERLRHHRQHLGRSTPDLLFDICEYHRSDNPDRGRPPMVPDRGGVHPHHVCLLRRFLSGQCARDQGKEISYHCLSISHLTLQRLGTTFSSSSLTLINVSADALLRSSLYTHFSESLSGLATVNSKPSLLSVLRTYPQIRAYGVSERFLLDNERLVDTENRCVPSSFLCSLSDRFRSAYWLTVTNQACSLNLHP